MKMKKNLSWNQSKNSSADWSVCNLRGERNQNKNSKNFFSIFRSSPVVDVPEVNSRIALRTIGKSINEDIRANSGSAYPSHGSAAAQANQNGIEMRPMIPPSMPVTLRGDRGEQETEGKKVMEMEVTEETDCCPNLAKNNVVVVAVETISPSLGEDKTNQRCVSFYSYYIKQ